MTSAVSDRMAFVTERDDDHCSICLSVPDDPCSTHCNHTFCKLCIQNSVASDPRRGAAACPICRVVLNRRDDCNCYVCSLSEESDETSPVVVHRDGSWILPGAVVLAFVTCLIAVVLVVYIHALED